MSTHEQRIDATQVPFMKAVLNNPRDEFMSACPSRMLEIAIEDFEKVSKDPRYRIDMTFWHQPNKIDRLFFTQERCLVCLAGSVLASRFIPPDKPVQPENFPEDLRQRLFALDDFRQGLVQDGLRRLGEPYNDIPDFYVPFYEKRQHATFVKSLQSIVSFLRAIGL